MESIPGDVVSLTPVLIDSAEAQRWPAKETLAIRSGTALARVLPRGKSSVPRKLGRTVFRGSRGCIRTFRGALLAVDPEQLDIYTTIRLDGGRWNPQVVDTCIRYLQEGEALWDVGASAGMISLEVLKHFGGKVKVYAFEPQESLARHLALSGVLNNFHSLNVFAASLGKKAEEQTLFLPSHSVHASFVSREEGAKQLRCQVETVDRLVAGKSCHVPGVIKIDVEGAELQVLQGASESITQHQPVVVFESDENMDRFGYDRQAIIQFFAERAEYTFFYIREDGMLLSSSDLSDMQYSDIVAVPAARLLGDEAR